jgi:hypothetical protein
LLARAHIQVERLLPDFSLAGNKLQTTMAFLQAARRLNPRLAQAVAFHGQKVPRARFPDEAVSR